MVPRKHKGFLRGLWRSEAAKPEEIKGPLGLNLLRDVPEPLVDFIFVHGLGGGSRKTWSFSPDPKHYWPKEWLGDDPEFRQVRIHSFGYRADWAEMGESVLNIHDFGNSLLREVEGNPDIRRSKTKIVFVAHSMGGIVIKKAYILAREAPELKDLAGRIHTLYFLATPHRGSDLAGLLEKILRLSFSTKGFVNALRPASETIASINHSFVRVAGDLRLRSFYETIVTALGLMSVIVVPKYSAILDLANEKCFASNANHRDVCKFDKQTDPNYKILRNSFTATIDEIRSEYSRISKDEHRQLIDLTGVSSPPVDELYALETSRSPGSCGWLSSKETYKSWRTQTHTNCSIFLLTGKPGYGKSVLSSHVINDLQDRKLKLSYFFFRQGNPAKSRAAACLRSLVYQMAMSDASILPKLLERHQELPFSGHHDNTATWRKFFVEDIFKNTNSSLVFWVIDALDECENPSSLFALLAQLPSHIRVFITSRPILEVEQNLRQLHHLVQQHQITEQDTLDDMAMLIGSRMDCMLAVDTDGREILKSKLLEKACGSFLWLSLVIKKLGTVYSKEAAEEVIDETPSEMTKLYAQMLESTVNDPGKAVLARSMIMWMLLASRPLTVEEMQNAIWLDINHTVPNLGASASAICGQLVCVNRRNEVDTIHLTAREYLLHQTEYSTIAIDRPHFHGRIAHSCLKILCNNRFQNPPLKIMDTPPSNQIPESKLADYACCYFSHHLRESAAEDSIAWDLLFQFLVSNLLLWIEHLAKNWKLHIMARTAGDMKEYLRRRIEYQTPHSSQKLALERWTTDIIRVGAKFGMYLRILPSSIHTLVPAMCPIETIISETYSHCQPGPEIRGQKSKTWDSCLTRFVCPVLVSAAVLGSTYSAASTLDGMILIFYSDSMQLKSTLSNGESLLDELALFGNERYLASIDVKYLKFWDLDEGAIIRTIDTGIFRPVALQSKDDESVVVAVTENGEVVTWETQNGTEVDRWRLGDNKIARKAAISQNGAFLAVVYYDTPTLLLFSMKKRMLIGRCNFPNNDSDFLRIPGMAFSTRPDVNVVLVLYEFRGIALYALESAEFLCYVESPDPRVMECSPDGSKLFVRDDGGRISIYELGAARASGVSLLYRFKGSPSGFLGVVFSPDCSRFAVLSRNQFEVWELPVLAYNELEAGNHTDQGQETAILADGSSRVRINAVCSHPSGEFVFCGKEDGSVTCFDTKSAIETVILDGDNFGYSVVTCIAFIERKELLVVAELSMGIKIYNVAVSYTGCKLGSIFSQIEVRDSPRWILANSSGTRLLFGKNGWAELWTIEGEKVNDSIGSVNAAIVTNHPLLEDVFVFVESDGQMRFYSWLDGLEKKQPPSLDEPISFLEHCVLVERYGLTPHLLKSAFSPPALTEDSPNYSNPGPYLQFRPNPSFMKHINKIRRLICITGKLVLFIDKDLWVCSLDLDQEYPARSQNGGAQRHFFLLPEWWPRFAKIAIEYIPAKREFVLVTPDGLIVVSKGLEFAEPWPSDIDP